MTLHCDNCLFIVRHFSFQWCQRYRSAADHTSLPFWSAALSRSCRSISFYSSIRIFTRFLNVVSWKKVFSTAIRHQRRCLVLLVTLHAAIMFVFLRTECPELQTRFVSFQEIWTSHLILRCYLICRSRTITPRRKRKGTDFTGRDDIEGRDIATLTSASDWENPRTFAASSLTRKNHSLWNNFSHLRISTKCLRIPTNSELTLSEARYVFIDRQCHSCRVYLYLGVIENSETIDDRNRPAIENSWICIDNEFIAADGNACFHNSWNSPDVHIWVISRCCSEWWMSDRDDFSFLPLVSIRKSCWSVVILFLRSVNMLRAPVFPLEMIYASIRTIFGHWSYLIVDLLCLPIDPEHRLHCLIKVNEYSDRRETLQFEASTAALINWMISLVKNITWLQISLEILANFLFPTEPSDWV